MLLLPMLLVMSLVLSSVRFSLFPLHSLWPLARVAAGVGGGVFLVDCVVTATAACWGDVGVCFV